MIIYKILIVDDDIPFALPLKDYFEEEGFKVTHVISGEEAVEVYARERPSIVLLDVKLPGIDGFETLKKIREIDNSIFVIMMTGTEYDTDSQVKGYSLWAVNYIQKPVIPQVLLAQINNLLNPPETKRYIIGRYNITIQNNELSINDEIYTLGEKDIQVMSILLQKQNAIIPRKELLLSIWKDDDPRLNNRLDSSISNIKKVLNKYPDIKIKNIYSEGYCLIYKF